MQFLFSDILECTDSSASVSLQSIACLCCTWRGSLLVRCRRNSSTDGVKYYFSCSCCFTKNHVCGYNVSALYSSWMVLPRIQVQRNFPHNLPVLSRIIPLRIISCSLYYCYLLLSHIAWLAKHVGIWDLQAACGTFASVLFEYRCRDSPCCVARCREVTNWWHY